jgi:hypothetical protein
VASFKIHVDITDQCGSDGGGAGLKLAAGAARLPSSRRMPLTGAPRQARVLARGRCQLSS